MGKKKDSLELYFHIPFCIKKCDYCDFLSGPATRAGQEAYIYALLREMKAVSAIEKRTVDTVFIGGGTPSVPECGIMEKLLQGIGKNFQLAADAEVTIEANPGTLTPEKLALYRRYGINRISIGLQSPENQELRALGRIHNYQQFLESYHMAREAGFSNINIDLMFAIPGQSYEGWIQNLRTVAKLGPEHISAYSLIIEEGTPFSARKLDLPDEDTEYRMYEDVAAVLGKYGYYQYEISNYAKTETAGITKGTGSERTIWAWDLEPHLWLAGSGLPIHLICQNTWKTAEIWKKYEQTERLLPGKMRWASSCFLDFA